jgi:hypothetical protein
MRLGIVDGVSDSVCLVVVDVAGGATSSGDGGGFLPCLLIRGIVCGKGFWI